MPIIGFGVYKKIWTLKYSDKKKIIKYPRKNWDCTIFHMWNFLTGR
jgi:hypothetical protein